MMDHDDDSAVATLLRRMRQGGLLARPDPTSAGGYILVRPGAPGSRGASLGAGRAAAATIQRALSIRQLLVRADGLLAPVEPGPIVETGKNADVILPATPEQAQPSAPPQLNDQESPLLWLSRRKDREGRTLISEAEFLAGERFRADVTAAALLPSVTMNWGRVESATGGAPRDPALAHDRTIQARQRVRAAYRLVGGTTGNFLLDVCGFLTPLGDAEARRGWPARSGKLVLKLALGRLAEHYGIATEVTGTGKSRGGVWHAADAIPDAARWLAQPDGAS